MGWQLVCTAQASVSLSVVTNLLTNQCLPDFRCRVSLPPPCLEVYYFDVFHFLPGGHSFPLACSRPPQSILTGQTGRELSHKMHTSLSMGAEPSAAPRGSILVGFL